MSRIEKYVYKDNKKLRYGYTTGSCAAAAAKAATIMLLLNKKIENMKIMTPKGIELSLEVLNIDINGDFVECAIQKDSGDDPDVTHGILVFAKVSKSNIPGIHIDGGVGIGRVTKNGLWQNIGEAAINRVPRMMIENEVKSILDEVDSNISLDVVISIPKGIEIAKKTFNERLGIVGGISILGTTGIVEPMSERALIDSIEVELRVLKENGHEYVLVSPGNYGEEFSKNTLGLSIKDAVKCSNFIGEVLDMACNMKFKGILLIGHIGKLVKLAGGIMNTHSKYADGRVEILTANAALEGGSITLLEKIMNATTTDDALSVLDSENLREKVMKRIEKKIDFHVNHRVHNEIKVGVIVFSNEFGLLCETESAKELLNKFKGE